jgi:hypothetical protein
MPLTNEQCITLRDSILAFYTNQNEDKLTHHIQDDTHTVKTKAVSRVQNQGGMCGYFQLKMKKQTVVDVDADGFQSLPRTEFVETREEKDVDKVWLKRLLKAFFDKSRKDSDGKSVVTPAAGADGNNGQPKTLMDGPIPTGYKGYTNSSYGSTQYTEVTNMRVVVVGFNGYRIVTAYPIA